MIPSETNETPFQISRCKGGKREKEKKREKEEYHRGPSFVNLFIGRRGDRSCVLPSRSCSWPTSMKKKKKRRSYPRNETNVPIYELDHVFFKLPILVFSITIGEKKEPAAIVHSIFRIDQTFLSIVSLFTRENEDRPIRDSTRLPYFAN